MRDIRIGYSLWSNLYAVLGTGNSAVADSAIVKKGNGDYTDLEFTSSEFCGLGRLTI